MTDPTTLAALSARLRAAGCVFAEDEAALLLDAGRGPAGLDEVRLAELVARRVAGEPLEPLLGWAEFAGRRVVVEPGVFVPRRRSELLVRAGLAALRGRQRPVVVELCCGVAAVLSALAAQLPQPVGPAPVDDHPEGVPPRERRDGSGRAAGHGCRLYGVDVDAAAVRCARANLPSDACVYRGDLYAPLPVELAGRVELLIANAPYVPTAEVATMPPEARLYEPLTALDGGDDGLDVQRRIIAEAPNWLSRNGSLIIETSRRQATATAALMAGQGLRPRIVHDDDLDATAVVAVNGPAAR